MKHNASKQIKHITITILSRTRDNNVSSPHVVSTGNYFGSIISQIMSSHNAIDMNDELVNRIYG